jgi:hypothetical protein
MQTKLLHLYDQVLTYPNWIEPFSPIWSLVDEAAKCATKFRSEDWLIDEIDPHEPLPMQTVLERRKLLVILRAMIDGKFRHYERPNVIELDGTLFIFNGHHRIYIARKLGLESIKVNYKDVTPT